MEEVNQINRLVRFGEIKRIQNDGNVANYEQLNVTSVDIDAKTDNANRLKEELQKLLPILADRYYQLPYDTDEDVKKKINLLIDIEECVKIIGRIDKKGWQKLWERAKTLSMNSFAMRALVGEPNLKGCVAEYMAYGTFDDLCFIETALFDELKTLNIDYIKFQNRRIAKTKSQGSIRDGYYLKTIEYIDTKEQNQ